MDSKNLILTLFIFLITSCTKFVVIETFPENHPGNPNGEEGVMQPKSSVLDLNSVDSLDSEKNEPPKEDNVEQERVKIGQVYSCPMHSEVTSKDPEDRCPKCNMKINKPIKKGEMDHKKMGHS